MEALHTKVEITLRFGYVEVRQTRAQRHAASSALAFELTAV